MEIDNEMLRKIAQMAKLSIKDEEATRKDLGNIITWVEQLKEVDTNNVEPLPNMSHEVNVLREDEDSISPLSHEKALLNAPSKDTDYFRVPKVKKLKN